MISAPGFFYCIAQNQLGFYQLQPVSNHLQCFLLGCGHQTLKWAGELPPQRLIRRFKAAPADRLQVNANVPPSAPTTSLKGASLGCQ